MTGRLITAAALVLGLAGAAAAGDVAGTWTAEFDSQIGVQKYTYVFKVDGETLTGTATGERMGDTVEVEITDGKVVGDKVTFTEMLDFQGQQIPITYTGTIAGDEIKFTRNVGEFATEEIVAKRKKD
ncbi:MAG: hypothetical protein LJF15_08190 [Acidobacteria bacterium]|jgi:hypothetical protein|nr:hypothetical protein [Acidobacteriota bacterium]